MPDPFDPTSYDAAPPFDPQTLMQAGGAQPPQQQKKGFDKQKLMRLIPLVAAAAKGGPGALEGLLSGYQQADVQRQKQATTDAETQRTQQNDLFSQQRQVAEFQQRQREFDQRQEVARAALVQEFSKALSDENLTDPEAVRALTQLYEARGQALGVRPGTFETSAMQMVKPSALETKAARKKVSELRTQFSTKWMEEGAKFTHDLPGGKRVSFQQLLSLAGMNMDPNAPQQPAASAIAADIPLDRQHAAALVGGNEALAKQIEEAMRRQDLAKSQPVDPQMTQLNRQIAEMRLENMRSTQATTGLPPRVRSAVDAQAKGFDSQPVTKRIQVMAEALSFVNSLDINSKNPADDQALIYAFAKAMDPDSVVREGEYAVVQKYAQSWIDSMGFNALRVLQNREFLTPQARTNMKATIQARYAAGRAQYDNLRKQYADRISRITGEPTGEQYLIDYGAAFPGGSTPPGGGATPERGSVPNPFRK